MDVSVVICAYTLDRWDELGRAIESCVDQTLQPHEIVVVIDHNEELLNKAVEEFGAARVVANQETKGLSGARNTGLSIASGDVIAFLDDDAYAEKDWLEKLTAPLEDPRVAGVGGWIVPHWETNKPDWFPDTFLWVLGCSYEGLPPNGSEIRNPIGANMAIRKEVFDTVGGFTSGIGRVGRVPLGCEETELCIRYTSAVPTQRFVLQRDAVVHHRVPASRLTWRYFWTRCWAEGLSKAAVSSLVGSTSGLSSERRHLITSLPRELVRSVGLAIRQPRNAAIRSGLILCGATVAAAGLVRGKFVEPKLEALSGGADSPSRPSPESSPSSTWQRVAIATVDIASEAPPAFVGQPHQRVWVHALSDDQIVGVFETSTNSEGRLDAAEIERQKNSLRPEPLPREEVAQSDLPRASIVVASIVRDPAQLERTITSLLAQDYPDFEVIVVDNRSHPDAPVLPAFPDRVRVAHEPIPGASAARNRGVEMADGEFVAFTDDDAVADRDWLKAIGSRFALNPDVEGVGGLVLPSEFDTPAQLWFEEFYGGFTRSFRPLVLGGDDGEGQGGLFPYSPGVFGAGCNMAFRRSTLQRLGGFNVALGPGTLAKGGEDPALFIRLVTSGGMVAIEPRAVIRHSHRHGEAEFMEQVFGYGVGLTAMYTALILEDPKHAWALFRRVPSGLKLLTRAREERSPSATPSYPPRTYAYQVMGMAYGPLAYARSVARVRRAHRG